MARSRRTMTRWIWIALLGIACPFGARAADWEGGAVRADLEFEVELTPNPVHVDQEQAVAVTLRNLGPDIVIDPYLVVVDTDGSIYSLVFNSGTFNLQAGIVPVASRLLLPAGFQAVSYTLVTVAYERRGEGVWYAGLTVPNTLNLLALGTTPFEVE
jgi:hypothetical protein